MFFFFSVFLIKSFQKCREMERTGAAGGGGDVDPSPPKSCLYPSQSTTRSKYKFHSDTGHCPHYEKQH